MKQAKMSEKIILFLKQIFAKGLVHLYYYNSQRFSYFIYNVHSHPHCKHFGGHSEDITNHIKLFGL